MDSDLGRQPPPLAASSWHPESEAQSCRVSYLVGGLGVRVVMTNPGRNYAVLTPGGLHSGTVISLGSSMLTETRVRLGFLPQHAAPGRIAETLPPRGVSSRVTEQGIRGVHWLQKKNKPIRDTTGIGRVQQMD